MQLSRVLLCAVMLAFPLFGWGQDATFEVSEAALNRLLARLGTFSNSGIFQPTLAVEAPTLFTDCFVAGSIDCPGLPRQSGYPGDQIPLTYCRSVGGGRIFIGPSGPPVVWQWWVTNAHYTLASGSMTLTATVKTRVGDTPSEITRPVKAVIVLDTSTNRLRVNVDPFTVPLQITSGGTTFRAAVVDVAKLYSIALPLDPQTLTVPMPAGGNRNLTMQALSITTQYLAGKVRIGFDVGF